VPLQLGSLRLVSESVEPDPLGPRTIPGVLDGAFAFMRAEAPTVFRVTAVLAVPMSLLAVYLQRRLLGDDTLGDLLAAAGNETNGPTEGKLGVPRSPCGHCRRSR